MESTLGLFVRMFLLCTAAIHHQMYDKDWNEETQLEYEHDLLLEKLHRNESDVLPGEDEWVNLCVPKSEKDDDAYDRDRKVLAH